MAVEAHVIVQQEREAEDELCTRREHGRRAAPKASQARRRAARRTARALLGSGSGLALGLGLGSASGVGAGAFPLRRANSDTKAAALEAGPTW